MLRKITGYYVVILKCLLWIMNYLCCHRLFNVKVYTATGRDGWVLLVVGYATSDCSATGCSWNIVFLSEDFEIFRTLAFLCFPSVSLSSFPFYTYSYTIVILSISHHREQKILNQSLRSFSVSSILALRSLSTATISSPPDTFQSLDIVNKTLQANAATLWTTIHHPPYRWIILNKPPLSFPLNKLEVVYVNPLLWNIE